jgi:hypothetical protein
MDFSLAHELSTACAVFSGQANAGQRDGGPAFIPPENPLARRGSVRLKMS